MKENKYTKAFEQWVYKRKPFALLAINFSHKKEDIDYAFNAEIFPAFMEWLYVSDEGKELCGGRTPFSLITELIDFAVKTTHIMDEKGDGDMAHLFELLGQGYGLDTGEIVDETVGPEELEEERRADMIDVIADLRLKNDRKRRDDESYD